MLISSHCLHWSSLPREQEMKKKPDTVTNNEIKMCETEGDRDERHRNRKLMRGEESWRSWVMVWETGADWDNGGDMQHGFNMTNYKKLQCWRSPSLMDSVSGSRCHRSQMTDVIHLHSYHTNKIRAPLKPSCALCPMDCVHRGCQAAKRCPVHSTMQYAQSNFCLDLVRCEREWNIRAAGS